MSSGVLGEVFFYIRWAGRLPQEEDIQQSPKGSEKYPEERGNSQRKEQVHKLQNPSIIEKLKVAETMKVKWRLVGDEVRGVTEGQAQSTSRAL